MAQIAETVVKRATPADPMPGSTVDRSIPSPKRRNLPPELGPNAIAILEGRTFMYSDAVGDVTKGSIGGLDPRRHAVPGPVAPDGRWANGFSPFDRAPSTTTRRRSS